ncbi:methyltransferase domain-containing protein [Candidatus Protofrankia californiensis]|uniref:methyltransferase domain-containing protein n=1 Tax=Candidatus Protofrankia californiensis TaxID=1839754 RepID=UPI001040EB0E|nr:methyltransferase domain-containing protein [Candidatus Protofrankia californiensis]
MTRVFQETPTDRDVAADAVPDWPRRARDLADAVAAVVPDPDRQWLDAVRAVPRHVLVPRFCPWQGSAGPCPPKDVLVDGADPAQRDRWLAAVYADETLVTQITRVQLPDDVGGGTLCRPTSSSTLPSLLVRMLTDLDVAAGMRVLEIGTGTGYTAALLCARLGDRAIASIDLHPGLIDAARRRLAAIGYHPALATGDGADGMPAPAPYDRIITTVSAPLVPTAWIDQLRPGGLLQVDLRGDAGGRIALLNHDRPGVLSGRFAAHPGNFMPMRIDPDYPLRAGHNLSVTIDVRGTRHTHSTIDLAAFDHPGFRLVLHLRFPSARGFVRQPDGHRRVLEESDGSWAEVHPASTPGSPHPVRYAGPRNLWATVEDAYRRWTRAGRPGPARLGLTVTADQHELWVDSPDTVLAHHPTP